VFSEHDSARITAPPDAPVGIESDCALAQTRCSRCHSIDRVSEARVASPSHWQAYVHRMRLQPQSGILPIEEPLILRCLVYRSFGSAGLDELAGGAR
jgi:hypothetical protein